MNPNSNSFVSVRVNDFLHELDVLLDENQNWNGDLRVSMYLPTGPLPSEAEQARIRFSNCSRQLEDIAAVNELPDHAMDPMMKQLGQLGKDSDFWKHQGKGLALFLEGNRCRSLIVAEPIREGVFLSHRWHLTPLLALAANINAYYMLMLSQNGIKLYRGSKLGIRDITPETMPASFGDSATADMIGDDPEDFSAHGTTAKQLLERFFKEIDDAVMGVIGDSTDPLVLAGVGFYLPLYRKASRCSHLVNKMLEGNPEHSSPSQLHAKALKLLEHEFIASRKKQLMKLSEMDQSDRVLGELGQILEAAKLGQVESAVLPSDAICWGQYDDVASRPVKLPQDRAMGYDLYQTAAEEVLKRKGEIFYLEQAKMPKGHPLCAELRY